MSSVAILKERPGNNSQLLLQTLFLIAIPVIIFMYFLKWRTPVAYGDDLYIFKEYFKAPGLWEKINVPTRFGKYRPVQGLSISFLIALFGKNLVAYYIFNVVIQSIIALLFALIANVFLRSTLFSLFFGLVVGLSRLFYFNIAQLLNGGALEGLAMVFFLLAVYFLIRAVLSDTSSLQKRYALILTIVFSNLSMYTHERYIVLFPFLVLVIFLSPPLKVMSQRSRILLAVAAAASIFLNVAIKKSVYSIPFFVVGGSSSVEFSFSSAFSFLWQGILTLLQINSGPEYLVGMPFSSLSGLNKLLVLILTATILVTLILYLRKVPAIFKSRQRETQSIFFAFLALAFLAMILLLPATIGVRLEQRWLEAPFCILVLMIIIAVNNLNFRNGLVRSYLLTAIILLFLLTDFNYFRKGVDQFSMSYSTRIASGFHQALDNGTISPNSTRIYIWQKRKDDNEIRAISWILATGYFFEFYQKTPKQIVFADSIYDRSYPFAFSSFPGFNKNTEQIVYVFNNRVFDITTNYLQDSLKHFTAKEVSRVESGGGMQYDQAHLLITVADTNKFSMTGFYEMKNGIRWTDGNASIGLKTNFAAKDSLTLELNTYMPAVCKNVTPGISLVDENNNVCNPVYSSRTGDKFLYKFYFGQVTGIQKISITSDTIQLNPPQIRRLSFPFISLELNK